jgi:hypothetical protein
MLDRLSTRTCSCGELLGAVDHLQASFFCPTTGRRAVVLMNKLTKSQKDGRQSRSDSWPC